MTLQEQLNTYKKGFQAKAPQATLEIMQRALEELRQSPVMERNIKIGAQAPRFTLRSAVGTMVSLDDLLQQGPVVLSFYRGRW